MSSKPNNPVYEDSPDLHVNYKRHFACEVLHEHKHTNARVTKVTTSHGDFITPVFMPVGMLILRFSRTTLFTTLICK